MRNALDWTYKASGTLAAIFLASIAVIILAQIVGRLFGFSLQSANEISGYFVAASASLGLAPTFQKAGHVRVSLVLRYFQPRLRKWVEVWCLVLSLGIVTYFCRWSINLVVDSIRFNDVSTGILPIPLWIPQITTTTGLGLLCVCLLDNLWTTCVSNEPGYRIYEKSEAEGEF